MARILLGVTGSVAAIRTPALRAALRAGGHAVRVVVTEPALKFFDPGELGPPDPDDALRLGGSLYRDADEWAFDRWRRDDPVLHIELRRWAELLVVAPLDANTLGKFALGLSDNCLTCLFRCWDFSRPVVLAPAMNTLMWDSPVTRRHLRLLLEDRGDGGPSAPWALEEAAGVFERHAPGLTLVTPIAKRLACGDVGTGGMAEIPEVVQAVQSALERAGAGPG
ncbi:flavoprotein [Tautonia sociabilis]|uniref:Phosphopantothenoylcysteine decarboxylase n=1 Tax=Tautonia sociabilis TaxID=2080755 RepID=A0A432MHS6_9BACT|nr:flavoprotein [Tautonia sociabilis]RUL86467.1 phosphopantothenoylcysteine decarboxylase [Tautonia sociabilis]